MVNWKILAIVAISLFILETIGIIYIVSIGNNQINNEYECSNVICPSQDADAYNYDTLTGSCYCYLDHNLIYEERLS